MSKSKPTPRPWHTTKAGAKVKAGVITDVAFMSRHLKSEEERKANADLIAAACNAAQAINPENPIAAAKAMPELALAVEVALIYLEDGAPKTATERLSAAFAKIKEAA